MTEQDAVAWLKKKGWHVTDLRIEALIYGVDLESGCGGCHAWSDGGPCASCIVASLDEKKAMVN